MKRRLSVALSAFLLAFAPACDQSSTDDAPLEEIAVSCAGKCDGWSSIKSLWADAKKLDLNDLLSVGAGYATEALNDALDFTDFASVKLSEPQLFALDAVAKEDLTLHSIDELVSGLARRFGDHELTTEVNKVRKAHLETSADKVFAEVAFTLGASLGHGWNLDTGDIGGLSVRLGFDAGANLEARIISAYESELYATGGAPLTAVRHARDFILPRSLDDVRAMRPGESFALGGSGQVGLNLGLGVPILIAEPIAAVSYNIVLSAGVRARLSGRLDVQLVRLDGDRVVLDVGVETAEVKAATLALEDGWGVQGLIKQSIEVAGRSLDLGKLLDKALKKQLNSRLGLVSARAEKSDKATRTSVARLRFALDAIVDQAAVDKALAQALRGDVRLAQALALRGEPGVAMDFDLSRSGISATAHAGLDLLGMSFFRTTQTSSGDVTIATPGGERKLMFDTLHKEAGWFFTSHGFTRTSLAGLVFDATGETPPRGEANLFLEIVEGDDYMERDKLLDHLDAVLLGLGGDTALYAVEEHGNALERYVAEACPNSGPGDACRMTVLSDPVVAQLKTDALDALSDALWNHDEAQVALLEKVVEMRLAAQATVEPSAALVGPKASVVLDYRLDDGALEAVIADRTANEVVEAMNAYLGAVEIRRQDSVGDIADDRAEVAKDEADTVNALAATFAERALDYQRMSSVEKAQIGYLGSAGARAVEVRYAVDGKGNPDYDSAVGRTLTEARAAAASALFDTLWDLADDLDPHPEAVVAYTLLALTPHDRADLRLDVKMDLSDGLSQSFDHYRAAGWGSFDVYAKGAKVAPIDGGQFDIDALINVQ
ncbi:MAG: hypothetical protein EP329_01070 [Deltaproteobacteria bacterium]|nr:MAG: hypothetical protein EP329_01070 [Deltaproteobacteria bacterium]